MNIYDKAIYALKNIQFETFEITHDGYYKDTVYEVFDEYDGRFSLIENAL